MLKKDKWKTKFIIVALGQAISMLGSHGVQFALIWWLAEKTSSPLMLGISGVAAYLPISLFSPVAGIAADRYNRKFISIFSDMAMGTIALIYAVLLFFFDLPGWTVFIMLCVRGIGSTFQQPAIQSIIPQLVPKDQLVKTNGWMQLLNSGSFLLGPVIGASLYAIFPMSIVLMSDVVGAILASIALAIVKIPKLVKTETEKQHFITEIKEGIQVFKEDKKLFYIVIAEALCMFFYAPLSSFYPLMTSDYFKLSAMYGSAVELSFAVGMLVSSLLFSSVLKVERKIRASFIGLFGMGIMAAVCGVIPPVYAGWFFFAASCICLGASGNVHTIPLTAYIQETVAPEKMGRAFSVLTLISSVTMPVGLLFSSPLAEKMGVNVWFFISGISMAALTAVVVIRCTITQREEQSIIRKFQKADAGQVMQIWLNGNKDAHPFIAKDYWELNYSMVEEQLLQAEIFVYEMHGEIQGFIGIVDSYIAGIFVDKMYRSHGAGKQLLDYTKQKYCSLSLDVYQKNKRAVAFYFREGFSILSEGFDEATGEAEYTMIWNASTETDNEYVHEKRSE